ncbi:hypothetical protein EGT74_15370 [Chitinophaga lutea]|uniref:LamG domain-containing protein n=1 Tax=Chitinophaga lutea TaxID=2488634 RepID=A0A3N4PWH5_9BACT|nr:LamG-like jellyroll fold domain-containing protein [Chitinophaga lutea]RPE08427.1 hypothetical protein EGT74_15370 [Chitinophaga lutea]
MLRITGLAVLLLASTYSLAGTPGTDTTVAPLVDLDADRLITADDAGRVEKWGNSAPFAPVREFIKQDKGRKEKGAGRPLLVKNVAALNGHHTIVFHKQELVAHHEDAFDHLIRGSGYTWLCVIKPGRQYGELKDVHSFFGNLKNGGHYEGLWAGLSDDNAFWAGSRNGRTFGRWDENNPYIVTAQRLDTGRYYLLAGRMDAGTDTVAIRLYIGGMLTPAATGKFPVNPGSDASRMAIGQERDAIEHPGVESFTGEIARFILFDRALSDKALGELQRKLIKRYRLR